MDCFVSGWNPHSTFSSAQTKIRSESIRSNSRERKPTLESPVTVLEYKYTLDALIEELDNGTKKADEIKLAICWTLGEKWSAHFEVLSYLDNENLHHRQFHGITHHFSHAVSGLPAFSIIVLRDLISYLLNQQEESDRQHTLYAQEIG